MGLSLGDEVYRGSCVNQRGGVVSAVAESCAPLVDSNFVEIESEWGDGESTEMSAPESPSAVNARC